MGKKAVFPGPQLYPKHVLVVENYRDLNNSSKKNIR